MTGSAEARVVVRTAEDLHTEISTSEHELVADEPRRHKRRSQPLRLPARLGGVKGIGAPSSPRMGA